MKTVDQNRIKELAQSPLWRKLEHKSLLITGATGMLGAYTALAAAQANKEYNLGIRLFLLGRNEKKAREIFKGIEASFLFQDLRETIKHDGKFDYIIHSAGPVGPTVFRKNPLDVLSANTEGTMSLIRHIKKYGCEGVVLASTHEVYGKFSGEKTEKSPISMPDIMDPRTCYVIAKQASENALACAAFQYGTRVMPARLSRLYGPFMNMDSGLFICDFLQQAMADRKIHVRGCANLLRPLCHVHDAASALLYLLIKGESMNVYNVQGGEMPTISEIAELIARRLDAVVILDMPETASSAPEGHWLNTDKLKALGWRQQIPLKKGIEELCATCIIGWN